MDTLLYTHLEHESRQIAAIETPEAAKQLTSA